MIKNNLKINLLFIVPHPFNTAPSQRLKFEQYFDYFKKNNINIGFYSFITPNFRKTIYKKGHTLSKGLLTIYRYFSRVIHFIRVFKYDIVYLHLEATPFGAPLFEYFLYKLNIPIIYDIDDLIYLPHSSRTNTIMKILRVKNKNKISQIIKWSKHVIVCTDYLKKFSSQYNTHVTNISSTINTDKYFVNNSYNNDKQICIGWSGSINTSQYLHLLEKVLVFIQQKYNIKIKVIGDKNFFIKGLKINAIDWQDLTEVKDLQEIDIGLYPLPKDEWVLGKSGLKALQYMGLGIPTVCTAIGTNFEIIKDGKNGFLAETNEDWIEKISILIDNPQLRRKIGIEGRKTVEEHYSVKGNSNKYLKIIHEVYNNRT